MVDWETWMTVLSVLLVVSTAACLVYWRAAQKRGYQPVWDLTAESIGEAIYAALRLLGRAD